MFPNPILLFVTLLVLLVGAVAAHTHDMQPVPEPASLPIPEDILAEFQQQRWMHGPWWGQAPEAPAYIAAAPGYPAPAPSSAGAPVSLVAASIRNPVEGVLDRIKRSWHVGRFVPLRRSAGAAKRSKRRPPLDAVSC